MYHKIIILLCLQGDERIFYECLEKTVVNCEIQSWLVEKSSRWWLVKFVKWVKARALEPAPAQSAEVEMEIEKKEMQLRLKEASEHMGFMS